jgi:hypothetical protein
VSAEALIAEMRNAAALERQIRELAEVVWNPDAAAAAAAAGNTNGGGAGGGNNGAASSAPDPGGAAFCAFAAADVDEAAWRAAALGGGGGGANPPQQGGTIGASASPIDMISRAFSMREQAVQALSEAVALLAKGGTSTTASGSMYHGSVTATPMKSVLRPSGGVL